ncbi:FACT complex subunit spt16, partial [Teratosphaeriaceae sp. CCFEE 6253]
MAVDMPFRDLGFNGVPSRSSVTIQPTTDCLVQLTEPPFMVITLTDIEVVHLERVQFGLKNFDLVVVFKDFTRAPAHINTIPVEALDSVKDWLDSVDIPYSEGPLNLNWATIMKTVIADPHQFFADGGWSFLSTESDSEDDGEEEEESAFEASGSEG